ncbi:MAG: ADP-heptose synthase [Paenibacillaceae bacterium]|uniref:ADP-heptose synthase n=1 Tax=Paenibacillus cymbidii TaxID=1639034 RepID=UPI0010802A03|nr:ADP-heptose synthase [Paenibacillus cymbidii]MBO9604870.1 ADP-heptose synthase [Paenibacillaceae bacterium]
MTRRFVIEAVMVAVYGELLVPKRPVEYVIPYSTIQELYDMRDSSEPVMPDPEDDAHVKTVIGELIAFFEEPFNKKKVERALTMPWQKSPPLPINDNVSFTVVYAVDNAQYGEYFDPIETELILTCAREKAPLLSDQPDMMDKVIEAEVPVAMFDIEDFDYAVEEGLAEADLK